MSEEKLTDYSTVGLKFWMLQLFPFQEMSDKFIDHHELANKLLIKRPPAGLAQERGNPEAIHQTETEKQVVLRGQGG